MTAPDEPQANFKSRQDLELARDDIAKVLACEWCMTPGGEPCKEWGQPVEHLHEGMAHAPGRLLAADALLASPALAALLNEARAEALDEAAASCVDVAFADNDDVRDWLESLSNPYRKETP